MSEMAVNTVQFRFPAGSPRPSWVEIAAFLKTLDTDLLHIETTYKTAEDRSLFIKFTSEEAMVESLKKNMQPRQFVYGSGKKIEVRMTIAGANMRYVRVFHQSWMMQNCRRYSETMAKLNIRYVKSSPQTWASITCTPECGGCTWT